MSSIETQRQISAAFQQSGHAPLASSLLTKISSLSESLHLTPKELVDAWEAHSLTKNVDCLDEASFGGFRLALSKLAGGLKNKNVIVMSGTGLGKRTNATNNNMAGVTPSPMAKRAATTTTTTPTGAATPAGDNTTTTNRDGLSAIDNLTTPSGKGVTTSPKSKSSASTASAVITPIPHNNTTFKSSTTSVKYTERTNSGEIVSSFNPNNLSTCSEILSTKSEEEKKEFASRRVCSISSVHPTSSSTTTSSASKNNTSYRHMFTPLEKRSAALEHRLLDMNTAICDMYKYKSEEDEMMELTVLEDGTTMIPSSAEEKDGGSRNDVLWTPVGLPKQNKVVCVGRICNEAHEGRLNRASIQLEGSRHHSLGSRIHLDLQTLNATGEKAQAYSLFPGQIVAVEGINSSGRTMQASRLIEGAPPPPLPPSYQLLEDDNIYQQQQGGGGERHPLSIMAVAGPFTTNDNLDYDPFIDVLMNVLKDAPDVVILCGPFVDERQPLVAEKDGVGPTLPNEYGEEVTVSYEYLFSKNISELLEDLYLKEPDLKTQFILVPSLDDAFMDAVYPQPPFPDGLDDEESGAPVVKVPKGSDAEGRFGDLGLQYVENAGREQPTTPSKKEKDRSGSSSCTKRRVHCVSNPSTLQINDITIGVTSTDILFHISLEECNANLLPGTRLTHIAQHLIQQRSYYPLFPPAKGASLDLSKSREWEMIVKPDILIVPSKLASFARQVLDTTIVVNPGELTKNVTGGTYAVIDVYPRKSTVVGGEEDVVMEDAINSQNQGVQDRVRVDIKRI